MSTMLIAALLGSGPHGHLVDREWVAARPMKVDRPGGVETLRGSRRSTILSLHPERRWHSGEAWLFQLDPVKHPATGELTPPSMTAYRGTFNVYSDPPEEEHLILHLRFKRRYDAEDRESGVVWVRRLRWKPRGVELEIPLDDGAIPRRPVMTVTEGLALDERGEVDPAVRAPATPFLRPGETLRFREATKLMREHMGDGPTIFEPHTEMN